MEPGAVANELSRIIMSGHRINIRQVIGDFTYDKIETYLKKNPSAKLKDIVKNLELDTDFATLRLAVTYIRKFA